MNMIFSSVKRAADEVSATAQETRAAVRQAGDAVDLIAVAALALALIAGLALLLSAARR
jgi:hypothetical protein